MKNIMITGATSGIGKKAAYFFSEQGFRVFIIGRNRKILDEMEANLDYCIGSYELDLTELDSIKELFQFIMDKNLKLDAYIHSAGLEGGLMPTRMAKVEILDVLMKVHYSSFVEMCKMFYKKQISNEGASIIGMSSLAALTCQKNSIDYSSSKAAMNAAVKVMSKEFLKRGIRVNAIMPANVDTPMTNNLKEMVDIKTIQPMGYIEPEQIVYLMDFLISDKAKYITGALIPVSAGMEY